jgi:hypothetical protein
VDRVAVLARQAVVDSGDHVIPIVKQIKSHYRGDHYKGYKIDDGEAAAP